jgi:K+-sensing histidine kinase KdpD
LPPQTPITWPWTRGREPPGPDDDKALSFLRLICRAQRGKLKVYPGYGAGVGKTWQMLLEGHPLQKEGIDVVAGRVETRGRAETAQLTKAQARYTDHIRNYLEFMRRFCFGK